MRPGLISIFVRHPVAPNLAMGVMIIAGIFALSQLTRQLLPSLIARQGQVVFMNSSVGAAPEVGFYSASKHALKALTDTLRVEVNPSGVRVLSVYPGRTATSMQEAIFAAEGRDYDPSRLLQPEDVAEMVLAALCLPRTAEVTDIHIRPMQKS